MRSKLRTFCKGILCFHSCKPRMYGMQCRISLYAYYARAQGGKFFRGGKFFTILPLLPKKIEIQYVFQLSALHLGADFLKSQRPEQQDKLPFSLFCAVQYFTYYQEALSALPDQGFRGGLVEQKLLQYSNIGFFFFFIKNKALFQLVFCIQIKKLLKIMCQKPLNNKMKKFPGQRTQITFLDIFIFLRFELKI